MRVRHDLANLTVPLAILDVLGRPELQSPGAQLMSIGPGGALWRCGSEEYYLPPWALGVLQGKPVEEILLILRLPNHTRALVKNAINELSILEVKSPSTGGPQKVSAPKTSTVDEVPWSVRSEAAEALVSLGYSRHDAMEFVNNVSNNMPGDTPVADVIRTVIGNYR